MKYFSSNLAFLRKKADKKQDEVAFELKFKSRSRYSNYEAGTSTPDLATLMELSSYFKITIDDLLYKDLSVTDYLSMTEKSSVLNEPSEKYGDKKTLPLIPVDAIAGFARGDDTPILVDNCEQYSIPEFNNKADYLIRVNGSSMYPKYNSGDIVACKKLPIDTFFQWNKTYVLDTIQGALVKRIKPGKSDTTLCLVSDNASYENFEIKRTDIYSLALVIGVIRFE